MSATEWNNQKLCGLYQPVKLLAETSITKVWEVVDDEGRKLAAKVTKMDKGDGSRSAFLAEFRVYSELSQGRIKYGQKTEGKTPHGFPNVHYAGRHDNEYDVIVMELLFLDLYSLRKEKVWNANLKYSAYLTLGCDMLFAIMALHQRGFVHRNVKPHNFRLADGFFPYLVGFCNAERYIDPMTNFHYPQCQEQFFTGTLNYASLNAHLLKTQSRRDDLISLGYSIIDIMKKCLPWDSDASEGEIFAYMNHYVKHRKEKTSLEHLCFGLPVGVLKYMRIVTTLRFDEVPDYCLLHTMLDPKSQGYLLMAS